MTRRRNTSPRFDMGHEFALSLRGKKKIKGETRAEIRYIVHKSPRLFKIYDCHAHAASSPLLARPFPSFSDL